MGRWQHGARKIYLIWYCKISADYELILRFLYKYKISSDTFLKEHAAENLNGGDDEFISWMGEIKIRGKIIEELNKLTKIEYVTK